MCPAPHTRDAITGKTWSNFSETEKRHPSIFKKFKPLTYLVWPRSTGNAAKRNFLLNVFNSEPNKFGHIIRVFLSTKAGAEGINLMNVRQVHIMEPYWNDMRVKQAIGRAIRQCSHATLPSKERMVDIYHYISTIKTHVTSDLSTEGEPESTDQYVAKIAMTKQQIIEKVEKLMKEVAIDCRLNRAHNSLVDHDIACFEPSREVFKSFSVDLSQDPNDSEILGDKRVMRVKLERINLPVGQFRVTSEDMQLLRNHIRDNSNDPIKNVIDVYALEIPKIVYRISIEKNKPLRFYAVT